MEECVEAREEQAQGQGSQGVHGHPSDKRHCTHCTGYEDND